MTIEKVTTGTPLGQALKASTWNAFVDAANFHRLRTRDPQQAVFLADETPANTIMIQNDTGGNLDWAAVVALGAPLISPTANESEFRTRSGWSGDTPIAASHGNFAVCAQPIPSGKIGLAYIAGLVACQVDISHTFLTRCDVSAAITSHLVAMPNGSGQIVWREGGTGVQWCGVRLGAHRDAVVVGKTSGAIAVDATGNVDVWSNGTNTTYQIEAELDWMHGGQGISTGKEVLCTWFAEELLWRITGAECE